MKGFCFFRSTANGDFICLFQYFSRLKVNHLDDKLFNEMGRAILRVWNFARNIQECSKGKVSSRHFHAINKKYLHSYTENLYARLMYFQTFPSILSSWHFLFASGLKPASFGKVVGKRRKVLPESLNIIISLVLFWIFFENSYLDISI